jgi:hypothetical protein
MDEESRMRDYYRTDRDPEEHEITKCEKYHYHPTGLGRIADPNYKHPGDTLHAPTTGSNYVYHIKAEFMMKHFDEDKLRYDLLPPEGEEAIAEVLTYGAKKYGDRNWEEGISFTKIYGSIRRHLAAWYKGEDINVESGLNHLSHAACNLFFLIYYIKNNRKELDDRP